MNCHKTRKFLLNYPRQDNSIPEGIVEHVKQCPSCQKIETRVAAMNSMLAADSIGDNIPENLHADVMMVVERARQSPQISSSIGTVDRPWHRSIWATFSAGVAICCITFLAWMAFNPEPTLKTSVAKPTTVEEPAVDSSYQSETLAALISPDASDEIYKKEVDGLIDFLGANAQLLFTRHDLMKKGQ